MDIALKTNDGFTLLEMLICLFIISAISLLTITNFKDLNLEHYYFMNDYLYNQSSAIKDKKKKYLDYGLSINKSGHINMAKTIKINGHNIIIHLGNGYITYE